LALHRAAAVALVTPLKDGVSPVAREHCAARVDEDGVLVLSEFSGAAAELAPDPRRGALLANPHDVEGVVAALATALAMEPTERGRRMRFLRQAVARNDVFHWIDGFCVSAGLLVRRERPAAVERRPPRRSPRRPSASERLAARPA
jgi:trehalose 6-phosphate synthase